MGIKVDGKQFIPRVGELNTDIIESAGRQLGFIKRPPPEKPTVTTELAKRPPLLCPGCPHSGFFYVLAGIGQRLKLPGAKDKNAKRIRPGDYR